ncbi:endolytic transglycosylase MltG [Streptomyces sp. 6N223]|uniref:endolytic transglycosylase MltG n=1 Tax=Streptomyces sp. 6N223 TaxID=3457412 RepID=UPI003FD05C14
MTEYGRGSGSEPWHPDDPLYGDQGGWPGAYDPAVGGGEVGGDASWETYGGGAPQAGPQQQNYQGYYQEPQTGGWDATGRYEPQNPYDTGTYDTGSYGTGSYGSTGYDTTGYDAGGYGHDPYAGQPGAPGQAQPHPPQHQQQRHPDPYRQAQAQAEAQAQAQTRAQAPGRPAPAPVRDAGPDPETGWDPGPDQGESDFFARRDDDDDDDYDDGGHTGRRNGRNGEPKRKRGALGCLMLALVLVGGVTAAGIYGYGVYQDRFGPAPDFSGEGTGRVQVEIPQGATASDIGNLLKEAGVVKSHDAFVDAASADDDAARSIQPGVYSLRLQMSAESALAMLTDPAALNVLTLPEGWRATRIYAAIDEKLGEPEGTTQQVAENADLGLPDWAGDDIEGFLFPARYDVGVDTTPEDLLTAMVDRAEQEFTDIDLEAQAQEIGRTPREILTIASLIQAEAQEPQDFGRVSRVIYNRLEQDMKLEFDSTLNYAMGRSTLDVSIEDTQFDSPYNTYVEFGLPPGPIDNPGHQAIEAALNPTEGNWLYFVTVSEGDTRFTDSYDEHQQNVEEFNQAQQEGDG